MIDITAIPDEELAQDRADSLADITWCELALSLGVTDYSGGSVARRIEVNRQIITVIETEQARRQAEREATQ